MKVRLLADADFGYKIVRGFRKRVPHADLLAAQAVIPDRMPDPQLLALSSRLNRVLVSHDYETMPRHFYEFLADHESPGLILIPQVMPVGLVIEELLLVWDCKSAEEFRNQIVYLPL